LVGLIAALAASALAALLLAVTIALLSRSRLVALGLLILPARRAAGLPAGVLIFLLCHHPLLETGW
jgi:hypothetical protein